MSDTTRSACRTFLRQIERHVSFARSPGAHLKPIRPEHAEVCAACARHLQVAVSLSRCLSQRPPVPLRLADPSFLESVFERVLQDIESEPGTGAVQAAIRGSSPGARIKIPELPWPVQTLAVDVGIEAALRRRDVPAPGLIWPRVRSGMRLVVGETRRTAIRRAAFAAASIALFALLGWKLERSDGTSTEVQIVFVPTAEMPSVPHPASVLRQGSLR